MNYQLFEVINQLAGKSKLFDWLMSFFADYAPVIFSAILVLLWFSSKETVELEKSQRTALYSAFSASLALFVNLIINQVYWHPRPFVDHQVHQLIPHSATESSFASDHAILAFSVAIMMLLRHQRFTAPVTCLAIVTAISRVFVGVHYPADVIGGAVLALLTSSLILWLSKSRFMELLVQSVFFVYRKLTGGLPFFSKFIQPSKK